MSGDKEGWRGFQIGTSPKRVSREVLILYQGERRVEKSLSEIFTITY